MKWALLIVLVCVAACSFATFPPPSDQHSALLDGAQVDAQVLSTLRRSCADCHSQATHYPWYSYVAPVSWLIRSDVVNGRGHMDFSHWNEYPKVRRERLLSEIANQVRDRDMPLRQYVLLHRDARLSDREVQAIFDWTQKERMRLIEGK
jgi:hypothetical protein